MTTFEPGASDVFTHGLAVSPRSTAFLASSPAPIITDGLEVFVQEVIAAMTTWPWSISVSVPSASVSGVAADTRSATWTPPVPEPAASPFSWREPLPLCAGLSEAGKDSALSSSRRVWSVAATVSSRAIRKEALDSVSETRSWGRLGPASDGTTWPRSSSSVSL
jgi:hypothetical protein